MMTSTNKVSPVGPLLFGLGIIIAIAGATKLPLENTKWPDTWPIFVVGALLSAVGITLWRIAESKLNAQVGKDGGDSSDPLKLLQDALPAAQSIESDLDGLSTEALCERVDSVLVTFILPAAEARQDVIKKLGMERGAEILVTAAFAERMLNRVWSAAADGHKPEAAASLIEAVGAMKETAALAAAAN